MWGMYPIWRWWLPLCPQGPSDQQWVKEGGHGGLPCPAAPPTFTETPPQYVEAKEGSSVTLTCMAFGNPKPIVTWLKEGDLLGANGKYQVGGCWGSSWVSHWQGWYRWDHSGSGSTLPGARPALSALLPEMPISTPPHLSSLCP